MMLVDLVNTRYGLVTKHKASTNGGEYSSPCPFCGGEDRFILHPEKDRWWCRQCGQGGDSIALVRQKEGLTYKEALEVLGRNDGGSSSTDSDKKPRSKVIASYDYKDENGRLLYQILRYEPKTFKQRRPNGEGGWIWSLADTRRVLYNLQGILTAPGVWLPEGEKDCDLLTSLGLVATCNPGGAGKWPTLEKEYQIGEPLAGKAIYIIPDNDDQGRKHAEEVAQALHGKAREVKILELSGLPEHSDVSDFITQHGKEKGVSLLREIADKTPAWTPPKRIIRASELLSMKFENVPAVIGHGILPQGGGLILAGESGWGKSLLRLELAVHLVMGWEVWGLEIPRARSVHIFQAENTERKEHFRLKRMLEGLEISSFPDKLTFSTRDIRLDLGLKKDRESLLEMAKETEAEVITYDPLTSFHSVNENDNVQIRRVLDTFTEINGKTGVTSIIVHHYGKPSPDQDAAHRTRGASSIRDWADTLIGVTPKSAENPVRLYLHCLFQSSRTPVPRHSVRWFRINPYTYSTA